ncbi:hypothetical protein AB5I41_17635 [Sphingomonas sp. MMS24-JH45]
MVVWLLPVTDRAPVRAIHALLIAFLVALLVLARLHRVAAEGVAGGSPRCGSRWCRCCS